MDYDMHPITLRFKEPALERLLRGSSFKNSYNLYMATLYGHIFGHTLLPWLLPTCAPVSWVFWPICVTVTIARHRFVDHVDQERAHDFTARLWMGTIIVGFTLHRVLMGLGVQQPVGELEHVLYMLMLLLETAMMHLQYFEFRYRMVMLAMMLLHSATPGWDSEWIVWRGNSFSIHGQPHDAVAVCIALLTGSFLGYGAEAMFRTSFLERHAMVRTGVDMIVNEEMRARHYRVLGHIGRGGSSDVFLVCNYGAAAQRSDASGTSGTSDTSGTSGVGTRHRIAPRGRRGQDDLLAIKRIRKSGLMKHRWLQVREEFEILRQLEHPFVVRLHDAFETNYGYYFAMAYASGGDLSGYLGHLDVAACKLIFLEMLLALEYLHSQRIIYRDLKPENTLIDADGHALLADFGVSRRFETAGAVSIVGTLW